jgi:hypothetical protein
MLEAIEVAHELDNDPSGKAQDAGREDQ